MFFNKICIVGVITFLFFFGSSVLGETPNVCKNVLIYSEMIQKFSETNPQLYELSEQIHKTFTQIQTDRNRSLLPKVEALIDQREKVFHLISEAPRYQETCRNLLREKTTQPALSKIIEQNLTPSDAALLCSNKIGKSYIASVFRKSSDISVYTTEDGKISGFILYQTFVNHPLFQLRKIQLICSHSAQAGQGRKLLGEAEKPDPLKTVLIFLDSLPSAEGFYLKNGYYPSALEEPDEKGEILKVFYKMISPIGKTVTLSLENIESLYKEMLGEAYENLGS